MSTPVRTTAIQRHADQLIARYEVTPDLHIRNRLTGVIMAASGEGGRYRSGGGTTVTLTVGENIRVGCSYNRVRWLLLKGRLPDHMVVQDKYGALWCSGEEVRPTVSGQPPEPAPGSVTGEAALLAQYDAVLAALKAIGIDPVRRVRIVTTEVPL
jgi:hypothetical protein